MHQNWDALMMTRMPPQLRYQSPPSGYFNNQFQPVPGPYPPLTSYPQYPGYVPANRPHVQSIPPAIPEHPPNRAFEQRRNGQDDGMKTRRNGHPHQNNRGGHAGKGPRNRPKKRERDDEEVSDIAKQWADQLPGDSPEEIAAWLAERKRKFPTKEVVARKLQAEEEAIARGEIVPAQTMGKKGIREKRTKAAPNPYSKYLTQPESGATSVESAIPRDLAPNHETLATLPQDSSLSVGDSCAPGLNEALTGPEPLASLLSPSTATPTISDSTLLAPTSFATLSATTPAIPAVSAIPAGSVTSAALTVSVTSATPAAPSTSAALAGSVSSIFIAPAVSATSSTSVVSVTSITPLVSATSSSAAPTVSSTPSTSLSASSSVSVASAPSASSSVASTGSTSSSLLATWVEPEQKQPQKNRKPCKYFRSRKGCNNENCSFLHAERTPAVEGESRARRSREPASRVRFGPGKLRMPPPETCLLKKLLTKEICEEHSKVLQCFRFFVTNNFFLKPAQEALPLEPDQTPTDATADETTNNSDHPKDLPSGLSEPQATTETPSPEHPAVTPNSPAAEFERVVRQRLSPDLHEFLLLPKADHQTLLAYLRAACGNRVSALKFVQVAHVVSVLPEILAEQFVAELRG